MIGYLNRTIDDKRVIGVSSLKTLVTWVDAAYAVYGNMRSQTGGMSSFGLGAIQTKSSKQKINAKSSTEAELIGVSEVLPYNIWMTNFLKAQGYELEENILMQDNMSAIKMEKNGRKSCTGNSRHIDVRYFFIKDRVNKNEIEVKYCPTQKMLVDFFI